MNNRFFNDVITIYHFIDDENVEKIYFDGKKMPKVYFRHNKKINLIDKGIEKASTGSITIPTKNDIKVKVNDYIIKGKIDEEFDERNLFKNYQVFKVVSVDDNRKGNLQHYKIGVNE